MSIPLPEDFQTSVQHHFGHDFAEALCQCLDAGKAGKSIRFNPYKYSIRPDVRHVPWYDQSLQIEGDPAFAFDPAWHAGWYYVQEAASMFVQQALEATGMQHKDSLLCLDLCAAPGGKSTLLSSWLAQRGTLISNEIIASRSEILKENLIKWGLGNAIVTNNDPAHFEKLGEVFDMILVDAPCSGEGLFRRDEEARNEWSLKQVHVNVERQRSILSNAWQCLKEGGFLVYSTCTFNPEENEEQVAFLQAQYGAEVQQIPLQPDWNITPSGGCYRFFPHLTPGEGFALSLLRKTVSSNENSIRHKSKNNPLQLQKKFELDRYLNLQQYEALAHSVNEQYLALTEQQAQVCQQLLSGHYIKYAGTEIGSFKHKDFIPAHALSQSVYLMESAFGQVPLAYEEALLYLRKEQVLPVEANGKKGLHLVSFHGKKLGFMKLISPTRSNNYYPNEWRIRQAPENNRQEKFRLD